jgi:4-aminobutyrate aminotransferase-like enzyme/Ser/Thr protein kinase RdoA (MazF antagonist)
MTSGVDFFTHGHLLSPVVSNADAEELVRHEFGMTTRATSLGSQQDSNFLLRGDAGIVGVLKVANPAFGAREIGAQDEAADLLARSCPDLRVSTLIRGPDGRPLATSVDTPAGPVIARVIRFLPGGTLADTGYLSPAVVARLGDLAGRTSRALRGFRHAGLERVLQWDPRFADRTSRLLAEAPSLSVAQREHVQGAMAAALATIHDVGDALPVQAVHLDVTDDNVVRSPADSAGLPDGLIDFSDLTRTWAIAELAAAVASLLHHPGVEPHAVVPAVRAFHAVRPISAAEAQVLWSLTVVRGALLVLSGRQQVDLDGANSYARSRLDREWRIFEQATAVPTEVMSGLIMHALRPAGSRPSRVSRVHPMVALPVTGEIETLDLSPESDAVDRGAWLQSGLAAALAARRLAEGAAAVLTRFGEARLPAGRPLSQTSPATVATAVDVWFGWPTSLTAPFNGHVVSDGPDRFRLESRSFTLELSWDVADAAPAAGSTLGRGEQLLELPAFARLQVGLRPARAPRVPPLVRPEYAAGWLSVALDPTPLLGLAVPDVPARPADVLSRRTASLASPQQHYYLRPPRVERGWRHHLVDTRARVLLDMVNNVTAVGHSHPRVEEAAARQLRRLNTNSRFNYSAIADFAERLAALAPSPLDTVFLVNSGSEATDLAIRLAMISTGKRDVVALREAYHGWTYAADAVSSSVADNPNALTTRPEWVHTVDAPNSYRGPHRGETAAQYGVEAAELIDAVAASGRPPAAFISETYFGNAGGMPLPDGYLAQVYSAVRRHGGLAIADEVQVGYGRLGHWFWGFEQQAVVPDLIAVAKAVGNGYPLGAVITSKDVADAFADAGYFFSSTGGSPVSCVVGTTVLDIIRDEHLQENAAQVGTYLKARLEELRGPHPIIGAVHGFGLYLGVELVRDATTLAPATSEAYDICERMLELGVVIQPTSDRMNVLKVKPPLCLDTQAADYFVDTLDRVLTEGW